MSKEISINQDLDKYKFSSKKSILDFDSSFPHPSLEKKAKSLTKDNLKQIFSLQEKLYAEKKQSLLIVLQAMDAAGKDSTIKMLSKGMNVQKTVVSAFKKPNSTELSHDFLWRIHKKVPAKGQIAIFNRSYFEDVLVVKVHKLAPEKKISARYELINNFENLLEESGTKILKFVLNISPEYQLSRFERRLSIPEKMWKFNPGDLKERKLWKDYMGAYDAMLEKTSTASHPWHIIPAETRWYRNFLITSLVKESLEKMNPEFPPVEFDLKDVDLNDYKNI